MLDVAVQIVNYKTKRYLEDCLNCITVDLADSKLKAEVFLYDCASGDDLSDVPGKFPDLTIRTFQGEENLGYGGGHNFLAKQVNAQFLLLLNPDTLIIQPRTIERLVGQANALSAQVVGPKLITNGGRPQHGDHSELFGPEAQEAAKTGGSFWKEQNQQIQASWVSGAVFLIDQKWFRDLGGFDENFFLYMEEEDLCLRLREKGGKIIYDPEIIVFHHAGVVAKKSEHHPKSREYFLKKHFSK